MSLPKIEYPIYDLVLPSNDEKINYRPFLVKEEKLFLMAAISQDEEEVKKTITQIVNNCVLTESFKVETAPIFDVEYILMNLRIKSIGDVIKNEYSCSNQINDVVCGHEFKVEFKLSDVKIIKEKAQDEIMLTKTVGVKMKWPRFISLKKKEQVDSVYDYDILSDSIDYVFDENGTYKFKEQSKKEISDFFESLNKDQFDKMVDFLKKMPRFEIKKEHVCEKCGFNHKIEVSDLASFF